MMAPLEILEKKYTVAEWLELEKRSDVRHEFYYGKLTPMPGEARRANRIAGNLKKILDDHLYEKGFEVYDHDVKTEVEAGGIYRYPDLVATPISDNEDDYIVKQAVLLAEVASENSYRRDQVKKRREYFDIPSLAYYIIISQNEMWAVLYARNEKNEWTTHFFTERGDVIELMKFELSFTIEELYKRVKLSS